MHVVDSCFAWCDFNLKTHSGVGIHLVSSPLGTPAAQTLATKAHRCEVDVKSGLVQGSDGVQSGSGFRV